MKFGYLFNRFTPCYLNPFDKIKNNSVNNMDRRHTWSMQGESQRVTAIPHLIKQDYFTGGSRLLPVSPHPPLRSRWNYWPHISTTGYSNYAIIACSSRHIIGCSIIQGTFSIQEEQPSWSLKAPGWKLSILSSLSHPKLFNCVSLSAGSNKCVNYRTHVCLNLMNDTEHLSMSHPSGP